MEKSVDNVENSRFILVLVLLGLNLTEFLLMGLDKRRAKKHQWRVAEKYFFFLAFLGGTPGAIFGMYWFHHKTRHWYFRYGLPAILAVQVLLVFWFCRAGKIKMGIPL